MGAERALDAGLEARAEPQGRLRLAMRSYQERMQLRGIAKTAAQRLGAEMSVEERRAATWHGLPRVQAITLAAARERIRAHVIATLGQPALPEGVSADRGAHLRALLCKHRATTSLLRICGHAYELGAFCGRGAKADVHEALDGSLPVALKVAFERDRASVAWEFLL